MQQDQQFNPVEKSSILFDLRETKKNRESEGAAFRLSIPNLQIIQGEKIALIGDSGSGKSTLLDMLALLSRPSSCTRFSFCPVKTTKSNETELVDVGMQWRKGRINYMTALRKKYIGYVMQTGGLLPYLNIKDNIGLSRNVLGLPDDGTVIELARHLRIERHFNKFPNSLSIGERQRVAIARALAHKPAVVIADEPTASLDPYAAKTTMNLFINLVDEMGITLIIASHAWEHLKSFGFKSLKHQTQHLGEITESIVNG